MKMDIFAAVARSDLESVRKACELDAKSVDIRDPVGRTALHLAPTTASEDVIQYLLGKGASVHAWTNRRETVIHLAVARGDTEILRIVMKALEDATIPDGEDRVDVNSLARKPRVSALQLAIAYGELRLPTSLKPTANLFTYRKYQNGRPALRNLWSGR